MNARLNRDQLLLLALTVAVLASGLGLRDPWPADEPRFALIARDMVATGDWLIPRVAGVLYPDKPPLYFWLIASVYTVSDSLRAAFLLPSIAAGVGVMWQVTDLGGRLWTPAIGLWAGAILLGTLQFTTQMKAAQIDGVLCFFTTLSLYGLCRHLLLGPAWGWYTVSGIAAGLGIITKGVGFLPLLILLPFVWGSYRGYTVSRISWRDRRWLRAPIAMLLVVALWLVPMWWVTTSSSDAELLAYRNDILFRQTLERYGHSWGHIKPPWYFLTNAIPLLWQPLILFLPWLWPYWRRSLADKDSRVLLLGSWILLLITFFSLSAGKRSLYIFPALPALALLAAPYAATIFEQKAARRVLLGFSILVCIGLASAAVYLLIARPAEASRLSALAGTRGAPLVVMAATGAFAAAFVWRFGATHITSAYLPMIAVLWVIGATALYPDLNPARSGRLVVDRALARLPAQAEVGFVAWREQFALQWPREFVHFGYRVTDPEIELRRAIDWLRGEDGRYLLISGRALDVCFRRDPDDVIAHAHRTDWLLVDSDDVLPPCTTPPHEPSPVLRAQKPRQELKSADHTRPDKQTTGR